MYHVQVKDVGTGEAKVQADVRLTASDDELADMRVSCLFAEAVLTEWLKVRVEFGFPKF
jgi:hypothetical protein